MGMGTVKAGESNLHQKGVVTMGQISLTSKEIKDIIRRHLELAANAPVTFTYKSERYMEGPDPGDRAIKIEDDEDDVDPRYVFTKISLASAVVGEGLSSG
jgi:hypothetical protein